MVGLEETISMPLVVTEQGTIRIKGSRVSLDSIIHHFKLGATAEQIVQSFPSLSLCDVYSSIAYYLTHRQESEEYLKEQETAADALQEQLESNPSKKGIATPKADVDLFKKRLGLAEQDYKTRSTPQGRDK